MIYSSRDELPRSFRCDDIIEYFFSDGKYSLVVDDYTLLLHKSTTIRPASFPDFFHRLGITDPAKKALEFYPVESSSLERESGELDELLDDFPESVNNILGNTDHCTRGFIDFLKYLYDKQTLKTSTPNTSYGLVDPDYNKTPEVVNIEVAKAKVESLPEPPVYTGLNIKIRI